jgi:PAS domain S-box-containing protein
MNILESSLRNPARLSALHETALLDSPPEEQFDRLTRLTSDLLRAPVSLLTLVDDKRQFFKSHVGLTEPWSSRRETPLSHSFCKHVVSDGAPLVINDAEQNATLRDNPAIQDMGVVAYAGFPLRLEGELLLGDLCVIDHAPRQWRSDDISLLKRLSEVVEDEIDQRVALLRSTGGRVRLEDPIATPTPETVGNVRHDDTREPPAIVRTKEISERDRTKRALQEAEERYRLVIRATNSAVWDWHIASGGILWNGHSHQLLRYRPGAMEPSITWWYAQVHPEDRPSVISGLQSVLEGGSNTWSHEHRFLRGDGAYATVLNCCFVVRDEHGRAVRVIGSMTDVTDQKRQVDAQRFLARASSLLDESIDKDVTFTNLARLAVPELADCCFVDLVTGGGGLRRVAIAHEDAAQEALFREGDRILAHGVNHPVPHVVRTRKAVLIPEIDEQVSGQSQWKEYQQSGLSLGFRSFLIVPLVAHGRVHGAITLAATSSGRRFGPVDLHVAADLAYRAALAVRHTQLFHDAQEAIRARDEIFAIVSHDLRNPLNVIQLTAEFILEEAEDRRADNMRKLELIQRAAGQMNQMVQDLLDVSSMEAGAFSVNPADQDVAALIAEAETLLRPMAGQKSITLHCEVEDDLAPLRIDTHRMLRVISNLVGNAIKFTPEGGVVALRAERAQGEIRFTVTDTGPGIPPEMLPHVFDRYWQARKGDRRGTGLGLAIAKGVVEAHGGRIRVESPKGGGASFVFTVPAGPPVT